MLPFEEGVRRTAEWFRQRRQASAS